MVVNVIWSDHKILIFSFVIIHFDSYTFFAAIHAENIA